MNSIEKTICDTKLVEQTFIKNEQVRLFVTEPCKKISITVEESVSVQLVIEYDASANIEVEIESTLKDKASLKIVPFFFTDSSIQQKFNFLIAGNKSVVDLRGLAVLSGKDKIKVETSQRHQAVGTKSFVEILTLVNGHGSFDYEGIIHIEEQSSDTDANQQNKNILLSSTASVRSIPTIEVLNKNVQCFHGSAMGKFDKDQAWYLQSRGLEKDAVQRILIDSFCEPVIGLVSWKKEIQKEIQKKVV
jgi:Fe-S cluster assembly protein SufD